MIAPAGLRHSGRVGRTPKTQNPAGEIQIIKYGATGFIDTGNLAIKDGALDFQVLGDPRVKRRRS